MTTKLTPEDRTGCLRLAADKGTHHMDGNQRNVLLQIMCFRQVPGRARPRRADSGALGPALGVCDRSGYFGSVGLGAS